MKRIYIAVVAGVLAASPAFAGISSENKPDEKHLSGPEGKGSHSADPGVTRSGTPGPSGPSGPTQDQTKSQQPGATTTPSTGGATGTGTTGTGATGGATGTGTTGTGTGAGGTQPK